MTQIKYTLINGGSGLIGSRLIKKFDKKKIKIYFKRKIYEKIFKDYKTAHLDFSKKNLDFSFLKNTKTLIHAASLDEKMSNKYPEKAKIINYDFIKKLFDACKKHNVKRLIKISTSKVYGEVLNKKITEKSSLNPYDNYTLYHAKSDIFLQKYGKNSCIDIIILRVSNGFGYPTFDNQRCWELIANNFCHNAYHRKVIEIKSKINYIKNFVDMNYLIKIIKFFNDYPKKVSGVFNVGSKDNISLYNMASKIKKIAIKNKLNNIKILSSFNKKKTNIKYYYSIKKLLRFGCNIKENQDIEINNLFRFLKKNIS